MNTNTVTPQDAKPEKPHNNDSGDDETDVLIKRKAFQSKGRQSSLREPITHLKNRSFIEVVFGSCFGDFGTQLTLEELIPYYGIQAEANKYFDNKCQDYDNLFRSLWTKLTGENIENVQNEGWKRYGFQNANPRSDFRGGGLLSLKQLIYFVKNQQGRVGVMVSDNENFLFAVSSINITYFLITYYHLSSQLIYSKDKKEICSRIALKAFCSNLERDVNTMNNIHGMLLNDLYNVWQALRAKIPNLTLLDSNMALKIVKEKFIRVTRSTFYDSFQNLDNVYNREKTILPSRRYSFGH
jgi:hypothetical protein